METNRNKSTNPSSTSQPQRERRESDSHHSAGDSLLNGSGAPATNNNYVGTTTCDTTAENGSTEDAEHGINGSTEDAAHGINGSTEDAEHGINGSTEHGINGQNLRQCQCELCQSIASIRRMEQNIRERNHLSSTWLDEPLSPDYINHLSTNCDCMNNSMPNQQVPADQNSSQLSNIEEGPNYLENEEDLAKAIEESLKCNDSTHGDDMERYFAENFRNGHVGEINGDVVSEPVSPLDGTSANNTNKKRPHSYVGTGNELDKMIGVPQSQSGSSGRSSMHPSHSSHSGNITEEKHSAASECDSDEGGVYVLPDDVVATKKCVLNDSFEDHGDFIETDIPAKYRRSSSADSSHNQSGNSTSSSYEDLQPALSSQGAQVDPAKKEGDEHFTKLVFDNDTDSDSYVDMQNCKRLPLSQPSRANDGHSNSSPVLNSRPTNLGPLRPALPQSYNASAAENTYVRAQIFPLTASTGTSSSSPKAFISPPSSDQSAMYEAMTSGSSTGWTPDMEVSDNSSNCQHSSVHVSSRHRSVDGAPPANEFPDQLRAVHSSEEVGAPLVTPPLKTFKSDSDATHAARASIPYCSSASHCSCCLAQNTRFSRNQSRAPHASNYQCSGNHCSQCMCSVWYYFKNTESQPRPPSLQPKPPVRSDLHSGRNCQFVRFGTSQHSGGTVGVQHTRSDEQGQCPCSCHRDMPAVCAYCLSSNCPDSRLSNQLPPGLPGDTNDAHPLRCRCCHPSNHSLPRNGEEYQENQNNINIEGDKAQAEAQSQALPPSERVRSPPVSCQTARERLWQNIWSQKQQELLPLVLSSVYGDNEVDPHALMELLMHPDDDDAEDDGYVDFQKLMKDFMLHQRLERFPEIPICPEGYSNLEMRGSGAYSAMIWTEYQTYMKQIKQLGPSACGPTAICNVLSALDIKDHSNEEVTAAIPVRSRAENAPLPEYILSRSVAGTSADDLIKGVARLTKGRVFGRFFHMYPRRKVNLQLWLHKWIHKGAVPLVTINPQMTRNMYQPDKVADAWHHQMVFGVDNHGVYLTNPQELIPAEILQDQLCSDSVLLVRRKDIVERWTVNCDLGTFINHSDPRWRQLNVLGQLVNVLRQDRMHHFPKPHLTTHITIPAMYKSGITLFVRKDSPAYEQLLAAHELPMAFGSE